MLGFREKTTHPFIYLELASQYSTEHGTGSVCGSGAGIMYHVRRKDKEIVDIDEMKKVLKLTKYVTLALCKDNEPYLVTLSPGYDGKNDCIYFHCASEGKKTDYLKTNNTVWGQALIDHGYAEGKCNHPYTSVHFKGKATFIENIDEKLEAVKCMMRQLEKNPEPMIARIKPERLKNMAIGKIEIEYMSGKKPEESSN
jgi:nitroimidazol reductase NimA-like FMN-containing flavoprotein (pyridoxamine 5'-phosphate oxidase superfamily)